MPAVRFLCALSALLPQVAGEAQVSTPSLQPLSGGFQQTVRSAGVIFEGAVTGIQCEFGRDKRPLTYRISFRVQQGVRGVPAGSKFAIREWAGLWASRLGQRPRYRVGENVFLFLYPPSRSGLTSTVSGERGKLEVANGQVALPQDWAVGWRPAASAQAATDRAAIGLPKTSQPQRVPVAWLVGQIAGVTVQPSGAATTAEGLHAAAR